ncbi:MAG: 7-cyano-7-deazaguanine synthase QueC [Pseudomonadota bacterium]
MSKQAIILLSGGLDSATAAAIAVSEGYELHALSFAYKQRHHIELVMSKKICQSLQIKHHKILDIDLAAFGNSALTDQNIAVPKNNQQTDNKEVAGQIPGDNSPDNIPITYVPARNTIFLSYALAYAEVNNIFDIFIGVNQVDYSGYPDCRQQYIDAFSQMANLALATTIKQNSRITIHTPLINLKKHEIIAAGLKLNLDYALTMSCYDPIDNKYACGKCDSCQIRLAGFRANNIADPAIYAK